MHEQLWSIKLKIYVCCLTYDLHRAIFQGCQGWSIAAVERMKQLTLQKFLQCEVKESNNWSLLVDVILEDGSRVSDVLIREGHAVKCDESAVAASPVPPPAHVVKAPSPAATPAAVARSPVSPAAASGVQVIISCTNTDLIY